MGQGLGSQCLHYKPTLPLLPSTLTLPCSPISAPTLPSFLFQLDLGSSYERKLHETHDQVESGQNLNPDWSCHWELCASMGGPSRWLWSCFTSTSLPLFFFKLYLFIFILGWVASLLLCTGFSLVRASKQGLLSSCHSWASCCGNFSCRGAWALGTWALLFCSM